MKNAQPEQVSFDEFVAHYMNVSAIVPYDDLFVQMMEEVWHVTEKESEAMSAGLKQYLNILRTKMSEKSFG